MKTDNFEVAKLTSGIVILFAGVGLFILWIAPLFKGWEVTHHHEYMAVQATMAAAGLMWILFDRQWWPEISIIFIGAMVMVGVYTFNLNGMVHDLGWVFVLLVGGYNVLQVSGIEMPKP